MRRARAALNRPKLPASDPAESSPPRTLYGVRVAHTGAIGLPDGKPGISHYVIALITDGPDAVGITTNEAIYALAADCEGHERYLNAEWHPWKLPSGQWVRVIDRLSEVRHADQ